MSTFGEQQDAENRAAMERHRAAWGEGRRRAQQGELARKEAELAASETWHRDGTAALAQMRAEEAAIVYDDGPDGYRPRLRKEELAALADRLEHGPLHDPYGEGDMRGELTARGVRPVAGQPDVLANRTSLGRTSRRIAELRADIARLRTELGAG
jgi:hypothetical protein